jgi:membrane protein
MNMKTVGNFSPKRVQAYLTKDLWRIREKELPRSRIFLLRPLRIAVLSIRGVFEDRAPLRASALTYFSLLSIVPVVAMVFGIAKGFGFEKGLESLLMKNMAGQEQVVDRIVVFANALLENVKGGLVAGVGLIFLLYTIIKILSQIESAFNDIWGIKKGRGLARKITDYLSLMLIAPILFLISSSATVFITSGVRLALQKVTFLAFASPAIFLSLRLLPYALIWVLFTFMYVFIPNTRIRLTSGILGGIVAGTMYQIFQWGYISLQIGVAKYNAVYGSFAALPLFFIWLNISWLIVLFGAEIAFSHQNVETYEFEQDCLNVSPAFKRLLSIRVLHLIVRRFLEGQDPVNARQVSHETEIPTRLLNQILYDLVNAGLVSEVKGDNDKGISYQPSRDPDVLTIHYVTYALEKNGSDTIPVAESDALKAISESLKAFGEIVQKSEANLLLKEI